MKTSRHFPAFHRKSSVHVHGKPSHRLMIVLRTRGCEYARRTGGCTVCGFLNHADDAIDEDSVFYQLETALEETELEGVEALDLLTLGSFLNDNELSPPLRRALLERVARLDQLRRVSFESRAEYITTAKLQECKRILGGDGRCIELGIGLESANERIRNEIVRKDLDEKAFLEVVRKVSEVDFHLLVYLLIKPPGLSEAEAIADAVESARFVFATAARFHVRARVAFEPVFICENTELESLYAISQYRLVNLWSVIEVIRQIHDQGGKGNTFIGLSDEDLAECRVPWSCDRCYDQLVAAIETYNGSQDLAVFDGLDCECREPYLRDLARDEL